MKLFSLLILAVLASGPLHAIGIVELSPPPGYTKATIRGMSDDGSRVLCRVENNNSADVAVWDRGSGAFSIVEGLADVQYHDPLAISGDGSTVLGFSNSTTNYNDSRPWIFRNGTLTRLTVPASYENQRALALSKDGATVVGLVDAAIDVPPQVTFADRPAFWSLGAGGGWSLTVLTTAFPRAEFQNRGSLRAVSETGRYLFGEYLFSASPLIWKPYRFDRQTGMLLDLDTGLNSYARIFDQGESFFSNAGSLRRWSNGGAVQIYEGLSSAGFTGYSYQFGGMLEDVSKVFGRERATSAFGSVQSERLVWWDSEGNLGSFADYASSLGVDLSGWNLSAIGTEINGVSADGKFIVGRASLNGQLKSFLIDLNPTKLAWVYSGKLNKEVPDSLAEERLDDIIAVSAGASHTVVLRQNGAVRAWGNNFSGQSSVPPSAGSGIASVAAGGNHTLALKENGEVIGWGSDADGQVSIPSSALSGVIAIAAGFRHSVALKTDGSVIAWGYNAEGQTNVPASASSDIVAVAAGLMHTLALKADGSVIAWGSNSSGQIQVPVAAQTGVIAIAAGRLHSMALKSNGSVVTWGANGSAVPTASMSGVLAITAGGDYNGVLKDDNTFLIWPNGFTEAAAPPDAPIGITAIAAGNGHFAALTTDGSLSMWGSNVSGQLIVPASIQKEIESITSGSDHHVALLEDKTVNAWGSNQYNQTSVPPEAQSGVVAISSRLRDTIALKSDGSVVCWGASFYLENQIPTAAQANVTAVSAGYYHMLALKTNGQVVAWGKNDEGQATVPTAASSGVTAIAAGYDFSLALKNGGVIGWGSNTTGSLTIPASAQSGVKAISCGHGHVLALKEDGSVVAWGQNVVGESEVPAAALDGVASIHAGSQHSVAVKDDGSIVAWGRNYEGQLEIPEGVADGFVEVIATGEATYYQLVEVYSPPVVFADADLEAAVIAALGLSAAPVTERDILQLTTLDLTGLEVADLSGLEKAANLHTLNLLENAALDAVEAWGVLDQLTLGTLFIDFARPGGAPPRFHEQTLINTDSQSFLILADPVLVQTLDVSGLAIDAAIPANLDALWSFRNEGIDIEDGATNYPPVPRASYSIVHLNQGQVAFHGYDSFDTDGAVGNILSEYQWTWPGGSVSGGNATANLPFGTTEVTLTVTDDEGAIATLVFHVVMPQPDILIAQRAYIKASNTDASDAFGASLMNSPPDFSFPGKAVAISGNIMVVGASNEDSSAQAINGNEDDDSSTDSGAAYVYVRDEAGEWSQEAYLKASDCSEGDRFGWSVAAWGEMVVVGAPFAGDGAGAAYVFSKVEGAWVEQAVITYSGGMFGYSLVLENDLLAVGCILDSPVGFAETGSVVTFLHDAGSWTQGQVLTASNRGDRDLFGFSIDIDGDTLIVGAPVEDSGFPGVNPQFTDNSAPQAGAAYIFRRSEGIWSQEAYLKASNTDENDIFGWSVSVSGNRVIVGAPYESSNATSINGDQNDNSASWSGAAYVFTRNETAWSQDAYMKSSNSGEVNLFGWAVDINAKGALVSAIGEDGGARGVRETPTSVGGVVSESGAVYVFTIEDGSFQEISFMKSLNSDSEDFFGYSLAQSGSSAVVSSWGEDSGATGVNGESNGNSQSNSGAAYVFYLSPFATGEDTLRETLHAAGLTGSNAETLATPFNDGVPNLLKYAFNMDLSGPDRAPMVPGGSGGLPTYSLDSSGEEIIWRVEFVRRKGSGLIYTPLKSNDLDEFTPMTGTTTVTAIDDAWELVVVEEPCDETTAPRCFSHIEVSFEE